jgi:ribosomal protein S18 acetylase RimI-like enzyme
MATEEATPADADELAAVHVASWRRGYRGLLPDEHLDRLHPDRWRSAWVEVLAGTDWPRRGTLVARTTTGELAGFVVLGASRDDDAGDAPTGEVWGLYVAPAAWGTGVGRRLLADATARLRAAGFGQATLWVLRDNTRARRFYEQAGWATDGAERPATVAGVPVTEVRYRRLLRG